MNAAEQAQGRLVAARRELLRLRGELRAADPSRRTELLEAMRKAHSAASRAESDIRVLRAADRLADLHAVRGDAALAMSPSESRDLTPPTTAEIARRGELQYMAARGRRLSDRERSDAATVTPVEALWGRYMRLKAHGRLHRMDRLELRAFRAYQDNMTRAIAGGLDGTAADGAEWVPTWLEAEVFSEQRQPGAMADDSRMTVARLGYYGQARIPWQTTGEAVAIGPGLDVAGGTDASESNKPRTMRQTMRPKKFKYSVPLSAEVLNSRVNASSFISGPVGRGFGYTYSRQRTIGDGVGLNLRGAWFNDSHGEDYNSHVHDKISADDVGRILENITNNLVHWTQLPGRTVQMHEETLIELLTGDASPIVRLTDEGRVVLPFGIFVDTNNALVSLRDAPADEDVLIGAGDLNHYFVLYSMGMRASVEYVAESDQYLASFLQWTDGQPVGSSSFYRLLNVASG